MNDAIHSIGGTAYRGKDPIESVFIDKQARDLVIGQRDQSKRSVASIFLGKVIERVPATDYFDYNLWLDIQFPHVTFIAGKRGSGKSYDLGLILEGLGAESGNFARMNTGGFSAILFDLQSQFWSLGQQLRSDISSDSEQADLLRKWNIKGSVRSPQLFLPPGCSPIFGTEILLVIPPNILELSDWLSLLNVSRFDPLGQLTSVVLQLTAANKIDFEIDDIVSILGANPLSIELRIFQQSTIDALIWRLQALKHTKLFTSGAFVGESLLMPNQCSIILMRELPEDLKAIVVAVLMRYVEREMSRFHQRKKVALRKGIQLQENRPNRVWVLIDEAHLVCPGSAKTPANEVIVDYVKRGRDAGLSLVLATQQPSAIDVSAISQVDLTILHKLTIDADIAAATARLPSPMPGGLRIREKDISDPRALIRELLPGEAILSDAEASRSFVIRLRPRLAPHAGGEPLL